MPRSVGSLLTTAGHVVDQLDDQLGLVIAGGRLAGENLDPRHPVARRLRRGSR